MKYIKNILIFILLTFLLASFQSVYASNLDVYYIVTNPGEDMSTTMRVSWHSDSKGSFLEYTTVDDMKFENAIIIKPEERTFSKPTDPDVDLVSIGFEKRIVCTAAIDNLQPGTEYMYRVKNNSVSETYYFKTASQDPFTFLHITDPQYADEAGSQIFNNLMTEAFKKEEIAFSFFTGDVIDRGGNENQWSLFYSKSNIPNSVIALGVGNHEYMDATPGSSYNIYSNVWYNAFNNNPKNGAEDTLNSSYYFIYNNALFIMLDTEANTTSSQREWFEEVVRSHSEVDFIIVGMHKSMYGSVYASASIAIRSSWQGVFDKYGVDLVLSGHDHIYARSHNIYQDEVTDDLSRGTTYIIGGSGGAKFYDESPINRSKYAKTITYTSVANLITVTDDAISLELIDLEGNTLDTHTINKKRDGEVSEDFTKEAFIKSIKHIKEERNNLPVYKLTWDNNYYGNVESISLHSRDDERILNEIYFFNDALGNSFEIPSVRLRNINRFTINIYFTDGTTETVHLMITELETVLNRIKTIFHNSIKGFLSN